MIAVRLFDVETPLGMKVMEGRPFVFVVLFDEDFVRLKKRLRTYVVIDISFCRNFSYSTGCFKGKSDATPFPHPNQ